MTVINKVNDDSESYFRDWSRSCFVIQCGNVFYFNSLIFIGSFFVLIISAKFLSFLCFVKVPFHLHFETCWWVNETSSKFSYHIRIGLFCNFAENEFADWLMRVNQ